MTGVQTCALLFQAEEGFRVGHVTGLQTCALPLFYRVFGVFPLSGFRLRLLFLFFFVVVLQG